MTSGQDWRYHYYPFSNMSDSIGEVCMRAQGSPWVAIVDYDGDSGLPLGVMNSAAMEEIEPTISVRSLLSSQIIRRETGPSEFDCAVFNLDDLDTSAGRTIADILDDLYQRAADRGVNGAFLLREDSEVGWPKRLPPPPPPPPPPSPGRPGPTI